MSEELIEVSGLCKTFETGDAAIRVLADLDLRVGAGERVAVVGQSGVGKTTLLQILGTLDRPSAGSVRLRGEDVFAKSSRQLALLRNCSLGFVFQFHHLLPEFNALENVMMPGLIQGLSASAMRSRALRMLEEVGLGHRTDEPTGNLDPATGDQVADLLLGMNRTRGTTLVVVTHSRRMAQRMGRILVLRDGRLAEAEPSPAEAI
jgi:lipoprotein-releasing system ATP-binding protein